MKKETWFIDIDGVILWHHGHTASVQWLVEPAAAVPGAREMLDQLERNGHHIVLVTARPEHLRERTADSLAQHGMVYHQLVMGVTSGLRMIVNDEKVSGEPSCLAYTLRRNSVEVQ